MLIKKLSDNSKEYLDLYYQIVDNMRNQMFAIEPCNSISQTYIQQILPHKEGAISLSENILKYTTDVDIETLAKAIIENQNASMEYLRSIIDECTCHTNSERDVNLYQRKAIEIITNMITKLNSISANNNLNALYLQALIYHHEGGINLAKNALGYDICPKLKQQINEQIIKNTAELTLIKNLLNNYRR